MTQLSQVHDRSRSGLWIGIGFAVTFHLVLLASMAAWAASSATATPGSPAWRPNASERLVKLPSTYLKKAIDRDFADSELGTALQDVGSRIGLKAQTLGDLQSATDKADGEVRTELRHQFLAEKQEYIKLMGERQEMQRKHLKTKVRLYERLLRKLERRHQGMTPTKAKLLEQQDTARQRFEGSVAKVDMNLFGSAAVAESKYAREYTKNMSAIEQLVSAIKEHPMSAQLEVDGQAISKQDYLRKLIADTEADVAIIDQEETILGYMAKLVALDAMALSEEVGEDEFADGEGEDGELSVSSAVDFFITR